MSLILFVGASPGGYWPLNLGREHAGMVAAMEAAAHGEGLEVKMELQAGRERVAHALARYRPRVLHFSGHCEAEQEDPALVLALDHEDPDRLDGDRLEELLSECREYVELVVLNACDSSGLAERLASIVGCAIGTVGPIRDSDAAHFSQAFYRHLADGRSLRFSFNWANELLLGRGCELKLFDPDGRSKGLHLIGPPDPRRGRSTRVLPSSSPGTSPWSVSRVKMSTSLLGLAVLFLALGIAGSWSMSRPGDSPRDGSAHEGQQSSAAEAAKEPTSCPDAERMVFIAGGRFRHGAAPADGVYEGCLLANPREEQACKNQEMRQIARYAGAILRPYCIDKTEVSRSEFIGWLRGLDIDRLQERCGPEQASFEFAVAEGRRMMLLAEQAVWHALPEPVLKAKAGELAVPGGDLPALGVTWLAAHRYCLSRGKRLPTETEWEFAARGPEYHEYVSGRPPVCPTEGGDANAPVFGRPAIGAVGLPDAICPRVSGPRPIDYRGDRSWTGVLQLAGNASEWTADPAEARGNASGDFHVVKGGSWQDSAYWTRPAIVMFRDSDCPSPTIGFRCVAEPLE